LAGTTTVAGTVTAALLLVNDTLKPPLPAGPLNVTVQASLPAPVIDALLPLTLNCGLANTVPVPLRSTTIVLFVDESL
jgi:hypothetical protein